MAAPTPGAGVVVGVIDSGIWYESKSFRPFATKSDNKAPKGWKGSCDLGADGSGEPCNGKIIGARYYVDGFGEDNIADEEFLSPRDGDGHGSHTASTAAGSVVRNVNVDGTDFGTVSGMAPGAQIAAYKVCWTGNVPDTTDDDGCFNDDSVAAIEDAVLDGVDVINYSIGGSTESDVVDAVEIAFLNAAAAGVFVAASAGNSGPGESTLDHPSPWLTTVAASTHKINEKKLVLGNGAEYIGASATNELPAQTPMVLSTAAAAAGATADDARLCALGSLDPAKVSGKLVVCERGVVDRVEKSLAVREAGGVGMVLVNPTANSLNADLHYVPSIHLNNDVYAPVTAYAATPGATGAIVNLEAGRRVQHRGAGRRRLLLAGPVDHHRWRHPQAGHRRPRRRRPGRGRPAQAQRSGVRPGLRHLDGLPAHRRHRRRAEGPAQELVPDGDQVRDDDHRRRHDRHHLAVRPGRRAGRAEQARPTPAWSSTTASRAGSGTSSTRATWPRATSPTSSRSPART